MNGLCLRDLARIVDGNLCLGQLSPLGGDLEPVARIVTNSLQVLPGEVYRATVTQNHNVADFADLAFSRGAAGVVVAGRNVEPWAGKFTLLVNDANQALTTLERWARQRFTGKLILVARGLSSREVILGAREAGMPLTREIACRRPDESLPILDASLAPGDAIFVKDLHDCHMSHVVCRRFADGPSCGTSALTAT